MGDGAGDRPRTIETLIESALFTSRWFLAPFYIGLVFALFILLAAFVREIIKAIPNVFSLPVEDVILTTLTLIDLSLSANLVLIVIFSGYENFVSKINTGDSEDRPSWMGTLDFSGLKMKLIGSIVAISAISLLRAFMSLTRSESPLDQPRVLWLIALHATFIISGVLFASMDYIAALTEKHSAADHHHGPIVP